MKVEVTQEYLKMVYEATKELRIHGCAYAELDLLDKIRNRTKYYLDKNIRVN